MIRSDDTREPVEVLCEEFMERWRRGESPTIEEYAANHESLRSQIHAVFPAMLAMEGVKQGSFSRSQSGRPIQLQVERLEQLGDYRIIREIGRGGMAIVYEAEQQSLHRRVAVKVFPEQAIGDSKHLARFQREAQTVASLHHTNIVPVFGTGEQHGLHYFVMQYLEGVSLELLIDELRCLSEDQQRQFQDPLHRIVERQLQHQSNSSSATSKAPHSTPSNRSRPFTAAADSHGQASQPTEAGWTLRSSTQAGSSISGSGSSSGQSSQRQEPHEGKQPNVISPALPRGIHHWQQIAELGQQVALGLGYAHRLGVLHRDIKPSNLVIDTNWRVWITDFGLAIGTSQDRLSQSGDVIGTLRYMAPEQLQGQADVRSDIYSLGLTLYELITLRPAFDAVGRGQLIRQVLNSTPPAPRTICPDIPADLETIVLKAISRDQDARYQSADELCDDLRRFAEDKPIRARPVGRTERLLRWSKRNPTFAALTTALIVCICVSLATVTINWQNAVREKQNAQSEGARAENNLALALASMDRFLQKFEADWMAHPMAPDTEDPESDQSLRFVVSDQSAAVLQEALLFYEEFAKQNASNPKLQRDTAKAYLRSGDIHDRLGQHNRAETAYRNSVRIYSDLAQQVANDESLVTARASAHNRLAMVLYAKGKIDDALGQLLQGQDILGNYLTRALHSEACQYELALTNSNFGAVYWRKLEREQSIWHHRRAIHLLEQLVELKPDESTYRLALARAYRDYYPFAAFGHERSYSEEIRMAADSLLSSLVADFPEVPDYQCELSEMLAKTASSHRGGSDQAKLAQANVAVTLAEELVQNFSMIPRYTAALAEALSVQANLIEKSSPADAAAPHARAVQLYAHLCEHFPGVAYYLSFHARALKNQGQCFAKTHETEAARAAFLHAIELQELYVDSEYSSIFSKKTLADYLRDLAELEQEAGNPDLAAELNERAEEKWRSSRRH